MKKDHAVAVSKRKYLVLSQCYHTQSPHLPIKERAKRVQKEPDQFSELLKILLKPSFWNQLDSMIESGALQILILGALKRNKKPMRELYLLLLPMSNS